ncbi:beta-lactamase [Asticcacaulis sp. AC460]|uniref:serine hydrolase domain-containing protein n=1 Tax=Asticcacaulis sp. AC460 TaxID=1282360 RepID=UPI0003C3BF9A|nr:serine hydrolase domain-containing protein [Asticcacaulis sp. AC460]ESQ87080.1 beta-lactamase [Asticcacaulis sp. AC460]
MKRPIWLLRLMIVVVAVVCTAVFVPWDLAYAYFAPLPNTVQAQVEDAAPHGLDGVIVYVDQGGKPPAFYAAGWKDRVVKTPADPHALFKIASISKLYIAVAAAKLVEDKRLSLDDTLAHLLPDVAGRIENADKITLRMMLQHRSGIPNFTDARAFRWDRMTDPEAVLNLVLDKPADFEPGSRHSYSNTNYLLVGRILDKTLGYDHQAYIKAEILTPLGLTHTYGRLSEINPADLASGYVFGLDGDMKPLDNVIAGGSMVATAQDVGIFLRALNDGSLLDDGEQAVYSSIYEYEHTGLVPGYQSIARYHKDIDTVVVQFVSTSGGNAWTKSDIVYDRIVRILRKG